MRRYVPGAGVDETLVWYEGSGVSDRRFLLTDARGSVIAIANASGVVTARNKYDDYGAPDAGNVGRFQYTGQMWLAEAGLYHYKARAYHPELGVQPLRLLRKRSVSLLQTDPIGYGDGMNMYAYVANDPVNATDPSGLIDEIIVIGYRMRQTYDPPRGGFAGPDFGGLGGAGGAGGSGNKADRDNKDLFCQLISSDVARAAIAGAVGGAVTGAILGKSVQGAVLGAIAGGATGALAQYLADDPSWIAVTINSVFGAVSEVATGGKAPGAVGGAVGGVAGATIGAGYGSMGHEFMDEIGRSRPGRGPSPGRIGGAIFKGFGKGAAAGAVGAIVAANVQAFLDGEAKKCAAKGSS